MPTQPLTFSVKKLGDVIDRMIADTEKRYADKDAAEQEKYELSLAEWRANHADAWIKFASSVRRRVNGGMPIVDSDLPSTRGGYRSIATFDARKPTAGTYNQDRATLDLRAVRVFLDTLESDVVSANQLSTVGFRNMSTLFREAVRTTVVDA